MLIVKAEKACLPGVITCLKTVLSVAETTLPYDPTGREAAAEFMLACILDVQASRPKAAAVVL